jgi:hypothetical protein
VWIGKVYIQNIVESLLIQPRNPLEEAALDFVTVYTNNTQQGILNQLGLEGPNSRPYLETGVPYPIVWFVLTCRPHIVPALHYLPSSRLQSALAAVPPPLLALSFSRSPLHTPKHPHMPF